MKHIPNPSAQEHADIHAFAIAFDAGPVPGVNVGAGPHHPVPDEVNEADWIAGNIPFGWHAPITHSADDILLPEDLAERAGGSELEDRIPNDPPGIRGRIRAAIARAARLEEPLWQPGNHNRTTAS